MHGLVARGGHRLAGDAVDLVEGVGPQQPVVCRADEELQGKRLALHVAVKLRRETGGSQVSVGAKVRLKSPNWCYLITSSHFRMFTLRQPHLLGRDKNRPQRAAA